jgi:hypothetical protein
MVHGQTFGPMPGLVHFTAAAERLKEADGVLMAPQMIRFSGNLFLDMGSPTPSPVSTGTAFTASHGIIGRLTL